jgi:hypothetical protein
VCADFRFIALNKKQLHFGEHRGIICPSFRFGLEGTDMNLAVLTTASSAASFGWARFTGAGFFGLRKKG